MLRTRRGSTDGSREATAKDCCPARSTRRQSFDVDFRRYAQLSVARRIHALGKHANDRVAVL